MIDIKYGRKRALKAEKSWRDGCAPQRNDGLAVESSRGSLRAEAASLRSLALAPASVLYTTDANYWPHLYVSLYSLLKNNPQRLWRVLIICDREDETFRRNMAALPENLAGIDFLAAGAEFADAPLAKYFTSAAYFRLAAGRLLPPEVKDILYLDCDTIVTGSVEKILTADLGDHLLGAIIDQTKRQCENAARLGLPAGMTYFNSGVLRINLTKWRMIDAEHQAVDYVRTNPDKINFADQDALNGVFCCDWLSFPDHFNYQHKDRDGRSDVAIVHHIGSKKPWGRGHVRRSHYWEYRQQTPYAVTPLVLNFWKAEVVVLRLRDRVSALLPSRLRRLVRP